MSPTFMSAAIKVRSIVSLLGAKQMVFSCASAAFRHPQRVAAAATDMLSANVRSSQIPLESGPSRSGPSAEASTANLHFICYRSRSEGEACSPGRCPSISPASA